MSRYRVVHNTGFRYHQSISASYNEARLLPARDEGQMVFSSKLEINPVGPIHEYLDFYKTRVSVFEVLQPHQELSITATSVVELRPRPDVKTSASWTEIEGSLSTSLELTDALIQSKRTQPMAELGKLAKSLAKTHSPHEAALAICEKIFASMQYRHGVTGVKSIASEAWTKKIGVCQDFAHITIGALRAVGIPARYVSGYLHPQIEPKVGETIAGESHAWVEWWVGEWFAFDPTNNLNAASRHIVVGRNRDYDDVPPLRGVFAGSDSSELIVSVEITREA